MPFIDAFQCEICEIKNKTYTIKIQHYTANIHQSRSNLIIRYIDRCQVKCKLSKYCTFIYVHRLALVH